LNLLQSTDNASGIPLYNLITSAGSELCHEVMAIELKKTAASYLGFMLGVDANDQPIVKHVAPDAAVKKGDRQVLCY